MNDVTVTELGDGALVVRMLGHHDLVLLPEVAAALREHFVAVHDAALVAEREELIAGWREATELARRAISQRDAAREQLEALRNQTRAHIAESNRRLAAAEAVIEKARNALGRERLAILSGYPVSPTHTEHDAEVWDEGWQQGFRDYQHAELEDGYLVITPTPNPYRVTPTEEPKP